jgi:hypothetical protein
MHRMGKRPFTNAQGDTYRSSKFIGGDKNEKKEQ